MRIVYLSAVLLGFIPYVWADSEPPETKAQPTWQDIVRSTQDRKPSVVEAPAESEPEKNTLYKVFDENGVPSFTDVAPADESVETFEIEAKPSLNVVGDKSDQRKQYENKINQQAEYRKQQAAQKQKSIQRAKAEIEKAKELQKSGIEPVDGDWQNTNKGRRFLKESYFARKQQLADAVEKAEQRLKSLRRQ